MRRSGLALDEATLDRFLCGSRSIVAGTKMTYAGIKDDRKRHDLIAYLATVH